MWPTAAVHRAEYMCHLFQLALPLGQRSTRRSHYLFLDTAFRIVLGLPTSLPLATSSNSNYVDTAAQQSAAGVFLEYWQPLSPELYICETYSFGSDLGLWVASKQLCLGCTPIITYLLAAVSYSFLPISDYQTTTRQFPPNSFTSRMKSFLLFHLQMSPLLLRGVKSSIRDGKRQEKKEKRIQDTEDRTPSRLENQRIRDSGIRSSGDRVVRQTCRMRKAGKQGTVGIYDFRSIRPCSGQVCDFFVFSA